MHLLLTRPLPDSQATAEKLHGLGHTALIEPLLTLEWLDCGPLEVDGVQAILLTSSNGARALARQSLSRDMPVYAVGKATAAEAAEAGFGNVRSADGDVYALARLVSMQCSADGGDLLHLSGEDTAGELAAPLARAGFGVRRAVLYRATAARALSGPAEAALRDGELDGVMLFSPRTAATFLALIKREDLDGVCADLDLYALSHAVSQAVSDLIFRDRHIARYPAQADLLSLLAPGGH